jgi:proline dehydrogenase
MILSSRSFTGHIKHICEGLSQALIRSSPYNGFSNRTRSHLLQSLRDAENGNYALGVKLVRGAYHEQEAAPNSRVSISPEVSPPVYLTKAETDASFNDCARTLVDRISLDARQNLQPRISVLFGTHNTESCRLVLSLLEQEELAKADAFHGTVCIPRSTALRVSFGQLFGMSLLSCRIHTDKSKECGICLRIISLRESDPQPP